MSSYRENAFDIIVVAGQSNAEGNGACGPDRKYHNADVYQMTDDSLTVYGYGLMDYKKKKSFKIKHAQLRKTNFNIASGFAEPFADKYIAGGYLERGRKVLIIKAAVGGAGFSLKQWGIGNPLHNRLCDMIDYALSLNARNRLVAILWHQGEHDTFEQAELNPETKFGFYYKNLKATVEDIRERYNAPELPFIAGEMADSWANAYKEAADAVENATAQVCKDVGCAAMVSSEGLLSNAQAIAGSTDTAHFCDKSVAELADRYFIAFKKTVNNIPRAD